MRVVLRTASGLALAITCLLPVVARAQPAPQDMAAAQALFEDAKRLMAEQNFAAACPKLAESQRLDPGGGTLLALALCQERAGKSATAWATFNLALSEARKDRRSDREAACIEHIRELEKKLTRVKLSVASPPPGLEVRRDGVLLGEAQWTTPVPVDPGPHVFEARAPGKITWTRSMDVSGEGSVVDVVVPLLEDAPAAPADAPPVSPAAAPTADVLPPPSRTERSSGWTTAAAISGAVGIVATGIGIGFGLSATSKWSDAERACPGGLCPNEDARAIGVDAGTAADRSTAFFVVGGAAVAAAAVLWFAAPEVKVAGTAVRMAPVGGQGSGGVVLGGAL